MASQRKSPFRNAAFTLGVANGALFHLGGAFLDPGIIMPLFLSTLTSSSLLIGLAAAIPAAGWYLPQLPMAVLGARLKRKLPVYQASALLRSLAMAGLAMVTGLAGQADASRVLGLFFVFLVLYAATTGTGGVSFMEVVAKTVPQGIRGRFFGWRLMLGGAAGFGAGFLVKEILSNNDRFPYPKNYSTLFWCAWVVITVAMGMFSFVREPLALSSAPKSRRERWKTVLQPLKKDEVFRKLVLTRWAIHLGFMAIPFYVVFAKEALNADDSMAGTYISVQVLCGALSNVVWGRLGDRHGGRYVLIRGSLIMSLAALGALTLYALAPVSPLWMALVFALSGTAMNGLTLSVLSFILDLAPQDRRGEYIGLINTLAAPMFFAPMLGGLIRQTTSFGVLFGAAGLCSLLGCFMARGIPVAPLAPRGGDGRPEMGKV